MRLGGKFPIHCSIYTQEDNRQRGKDTNTVGDTTQSSMTQETMTELVECNTQLHKTLQGLWSDALTQHKLQQQIHQRELRVGDGGGLAQRLVKAQYCCMHQLTSHPTTERRLGMATNISEGFVMLMMVHTK